MDEALEKIRTSLDLNKQRIIDTKKERAEFFDLKKSGETIQTLKTEWDDLSRELTRLYNLTIVLEEERAYFIRDAEDSYGVPALRTELDKQLETRVTHLRAYDLPEQQLQRRQQHREQWLAKHP
ncbi:hypothetical protein D9M70_505670 [compost metagenome]